MKSIKWLLSALCLTFSLTAHAQQMQEEEEVLSAGEFLESCQQAGGLGICNTFIVTMVQTVTAMQESGQAPQLFCINPQVVSLDEVRNTLVSRLEKIPNRLQEDAYTLISEILYQRYPCNATSF